LYLVDKYPDKNWCYTTLSMRDDFDLGVVNNNPNKNWYLTRYIRNNLTIDEFIKYKSIKWDMLEIIDREDIMLFVDARPDYDWDWCNISSRYITMDFIERYQDKSWDLENVFTNNLKCRVKVLLINYHIKVGIGNTSHNINTLKGENMICVFSE